MLETIKTRRSTRQFKAELPSDQDIAAIVEAGQFAPSGCNVQQNHFLVIKNPAVLAKLRELVRQAFAEMEIDEKASVSIKHSVEASKRGDYLQSLGMTDSERVFGAVAIGRPATDDGKPAREPLPRTGNKVTYI